MKLIEFYGHLINPKKITYISKPRYNFFANSNKFSNYSFQIAFDNDHFLDIFEEIVPNNSQENQEKTKKKIKEKIDNLLKKL